MEKDSEGGGGDGLIIIRLDKWSGWDGIDERDSENR